MSLDVSKIGNVSALRSDAGIPKTTNFSANTEQKPDSLELSQNANEMKPPRISRLRLWLGILSKKQGNKINQSGKLPKKAKFVKAEKGDYKIVNNFFGLKQGTQILPDGYEVKRNLLGFAKVVPTGTKGLFLRND